MSKIACQCWPQTGQVMASWISRSEEHTSELQSQSNLVCRLLLEKKNSRSYNSIDRAGVDVGPDSSAGAHTGLYGLAALFPPGGLLVRIVLDNTAFSRLDVITAAG